MFEARKVQFARRLNPDVWQRVEPLPWQMLLVPPLQLLQHEAQLAMAQAQVSRQMG